MLRILFVISLALVPSLFAEAEDADLVQLRETISKIVDVEAMESQERMDWKAGKDELASLLELHARELKLLDEELAKAGNSAPGHEQATAEMKGRIDELKQVRSLVAEAVARNIPRVAGLAKRFPAPLLKEAEAELAQVAGWKPSDEPRDALRAILDVLAKAGQFNRRLTRSSEIIEGRQVEVLYLGLGCAYYMDPKDKAGIGRPAEGAWEWVSKPEIRSELAAAFEILDKKRQPAMVTLPIEIR